jgi:hypothetical protein
MRRSLTVFKFPTTLGCCFILAALLAPSAQAIQIDVDPGVVGEAASSIIFSLDNPETVVDLTFIDLKTLEGSGPAGFGMSATFPVISFTGYLSDAAGDEISGTAFVGATETGVVEVQAGSNIWLGMHFEGDFRGGEEYTLFWTDIAFTKPTVGVVPEPGTALLMGLGLAGLGAAGRSRREESEGTT